MSLREDPPVLRVALVEDDVAFRDAMAAAIGSAGDMELVAAMGNRALALQRLAQLDAHVLVVDLGLPDGSGVDVIRAAQGLHAEMAIMVATTFADETNVIRSIEAGARGYLLKDSPAAKLVEDIRSLHRGGSPISPMIARHILKRFRPPVAPAAAPVERLSGREHEVLELIAKGFSYQEIAGLMQISRFTVMTFVRRIYAKLEVRTKIEAIDEARHQGILPP